MEHQQKKMLIFVCFSLVSLIVDIPLASTKKNGVNPMADQLLSLTIIDFPEKVISGGRIRCKIELKNVSNKELKVQQMAIYSPIEYIFRDTDSGRKMIISQKKFDYYMKAGRNIPRPTIQYVDLKPGKSLVHKEGDLSVNSIDPIIPGNYSVVATIEFKEEIIVSDPVNISICSPKIEQVQSLISNQYNEIHSSFIETNCFEKPAIYFRLSFSSHYNIGAAGIPFQIQKYVTGTAISERIGSNLHNYWMCYFSNNEVTGICGGPYIKFRAFGTVEADFESPRLIPQGFMINEDKGTFFLYGRSGSFFKMQRVRFDENGGEKETPVTVSENEILDMKIQYNEESRHFNLLWIEMSDKEYILKAGIFSEDSTATIGSVRELYSSEFDPVVLEIQSVLSESSQRNDYAALFLDKNNDMLHFIQSPYNSANPGTSKPVPLPPGSSDQWGTAPSFDFNPLIVTHSDGHLLWYEINGDKQWRSFAHDKKGVRDLKLFTDSRNRYWAHWVNQETGLQFKRIPYKIVQKP